MKHVKWPSIEQFRSVVRDVQNKAQFVGLAEDGTAIMNRQAVLPALTFEGTVKLHGTNAAVGVFKEQVWFQSRERIITPENDNAGFAMFAVGRTNMFKEIANKAVQHFGTNEKPVLIFGEWCGGNIQKGVAISQLPKMFVVFGIASVEDDGKKAYLKRQDVSNCVTSDETIKSIYDFQTFTKTIDFENPHESVNEINAITDAVENECPVGKALGVSGIGEGVVWRCIDEGYEDSRFWFKAKGEKHSKSKVKTLATVDVERINNLNELAAKLAHNGRLEQMAQQVFDTLNGGQVDAKKTGEFIKAVMQDIFKEELDTISASGFTGKDLNSPVAKLCRDWMFQNA